MSPVQVIGWTASALFALCGAPQALKSYREGHSRGIAHLLIWMWLSGEVLMQIYVFCRHGWDLPLLVQYWLNTVFVAIIIRYKYWPRRTEGEKD